MATLAPDVPRRHLVEPALLADARATGLTPSLAARVHAIVEAAGAAVVVCTCSTIGGCVEAVTIAGCTTMRIDRPMAEAAVRSGERIAVVATVASTLGPTRALLLDAARRPVVISEVLCEGAWARFEAGDNQGYLAAIAPAIVSAAADADVVVLAQASMAGAAALCTVRVPVLSSPRLGVKAAVDLWRARSA